MHAKSRRAPSYGSRVGRNSGSRVSSVCRDENGNERKEGSRQENLLLGVEGKLLLRRAERDAKRASSVLMWKLVISRNETKERHVSLETLLGEEIDLLEVGEHTEAPACQWRVASHMARRGRLVDGNGAM